MTASCSPSRGVQLLLRRCPRLCCHRPLYQHQTSFTSVVALPPVSQPSSGHLIAPCRYSTHAPSHLLRSSRPLRTSHRTLPSTSTPPTSTTSLHSPSHPTPPIQPIRHASIHVTDTSPSEFAEQFDRLAELVQAAVDRPELEAANVELSFASGVLALRTPHHGTYVLNQHGVTRQVWLSSPLSGPSKYNWHRDRTAGGADGEGGASRTGQWCNERDVEQDLMRLLQREFSIVFETDIKFDEPF